MKRLIIIIVAIVVIVGVAVAQPEPLGEPIEFRPGRTIRKVDSKTCEITVIHKQMVEKSSLLEERQTHEANIAHSQEQIARIDAMLVVFE